MSHTYESLAVAMVEAFVQGGMVKPLLPEGRREDLVSALPFLVTDPDLLAAYTGTIRAEISRRGDEVRGRVLSLGDENIPDAQIAAEGFVNLTDDQLADYAFSPWALEAIYEFLYDAESGLGTWYFDAILEVAAARSKDHPTVREEFSEDERLAIDAIASFAEGAMQKAALPEGRRDEYVALLFGVFARATRLLSYVEALMTERQRRGLEKSMLRLPPVVIPDALIFSGKFADLSDDQLAYVVSSPESLLSIDDLLKNSDSEVGPWYLDGRLAAFGMQERGSSEV